MYLRKWFIILYYYSKFFTVTQHWSLTADIVLEQGKITNYRTDMSMILFKYFDENTMNYYSFQPNLIMQLFKVNILLLKNQLLFYAMTIIIVFKI